MITATVKTTVQAIPQRHQEFLDRIREIVGRDHVVNGAEELELRARDTVPGAIPPIAFIYPGSTEEVSQLVRLADQYRVSVWPHSTGRSWGWSNSPTVGNAVVVSLERMNRIVHVDEKLAYAVIEPGVTYQDLNDYLKNNRIKLWPDCIGGPPKGSVLGNALDRGVGVTTYGEHFASLCGLEVVLPSGAVVQTGNYPQGKEGTRYTYKWGVGPYIEGLFSQGNLGIVTQGGIWLMPEPEAHLMFGFTLANEDRLAPLLDVLRQLALDGVIPDKIRVTNDFAVLTLLTQWVKERGLEAGVSLSDDDMRRLEQKYRFGAWSFCSSIYGRKEHVNALREIIVRELSQFGRVLFFDDKKIERIEKMLPHVLKLHRSRSRLVDWLSGTILKLSLPMVQALPPLYGIYKGIPTEKIVRRAYFRSQVEPPEKDVHVAKDRVGLMWFGPLLPLDGKPVVEYMDQCRRKFKTRGFDCYITMLMLNSRTIVSLMGIIYRTEDPAETERAVALYRELQDDALDRGYQQWRCGRLGWDSLYRDSPDLLAFNSQIRDALDPHHTIAPGKYGIA